MESNSSKYQPPLSDPFNSSFATQNSDPRYGKGSLFGEEKATPYQPIGESKSHMTQGLSSEAFNSFSPLTELNNKFRKCGYVTFKIFVILLAVWNLYETIFTLKTLHSQDQITRLIVLFYTGFKLVEFYVFTMLFLAMQYKDVRKSEKVVTVLGIYMIAYAVVNLIVVSMVYYEGLGFELPGFIEDLNFDFVGDKHILSVFYVMFLILLNELLYGFLLFGAFKVRSLLREIEHLTLREYVYQP
jgi:hypothetical protein